MGYALTAWLHSHMAYAWENRHERRGQGTVEYVGVVVMVTLLIGGLAAAARGWAPQVGSGLRRALTEAISRLSGAFGAEAA